MTGSEHSARSTNTCRLQITRNYRTLTVVQSASAYFFIELAILAYAVGFGWEYWNLKGLRSPAFLCAAVGLFVLWFTLDQIAVRLGLWAFPPGSTLAIRAFSLPIEEYLVFVLHTFVCFVMVNRYTRDGG